MEASDYRKKAGVASTSVNPWFEGSDFLLDMETQNKRPRRSELISTKKGKLDGSYMEFLRGLEDFWDAKFGDDDIDEDVEDSDYLLFLKNLKEHENGYMCDFPLENENGVLLSIIYEEENCSPNDVKRKTARMSIGTKKNNQKKKWSLNQDGDVEFRRKSYGGENNSRDELKSLNVVSKPKSYVKNPDFGHNRADEIKRRKTTVSSRDACFRESRSFYVDGDQRSGPKSSVLEETTPEIDDHYELFLGKLQYKGEDVFCDFGDQNRIYYEPRKSRKQHATKIEVEPLAANISALKSAPRQPTPPPKTQITLPTNLTTRDAKNMLSAPNNPHKCVAEQNKETLNECKRELRHYLRKPYDQEEYDELLEEMSARKPILSHKETRSGGFDKQGPIGKSYLDIHKDVKEKIIEVRLEDNKVLNLLRMLNFYLQKVPSLRGFMPWKDESFTNILPGPSHEYF